jgi:hypothetical protein
MNTTTPSKSLIDNSLASILDDDPRFWRSPFHSNASQPGVFTRQGDNTTILNSFHNFLFSS